MMNNDDDGNLVGFIFLVLSMNMGTSDKEQSQNPLIDANYKINNDRQSVIMEDIRIGINVELNPLNARNCQGIIHGST
jgi:hypothetical protein